LRLALIVSFPVIGLSQFLRTTPEQLSAHPVMQVTQWVTNSLMILPLFAAGVWAGDWVADQVGLGRTHSLEVCKRALVTALLVALALMPLWYERNKVDAQARAQALVSPHSAGSADVYWVRPGVVVALVCVCLVPVAAWAGRSITRRLWARLPRFAGTFARGSVAMLLIAAVPALAWLLDQAAQRAYASQVSYTSASALLSIHGHHTLPRDRRGPHLPAEPPVTAAPFAFAYQAAHALQDGLAGQAVGFPVAVAALLCDARREPGHGRHRMQSHERGRQG
jgi:hypothetical protein